MRGIKNSDGLSADVIASKRNLLMIILVREPAAESEYFLC